MIDCRVIGERSSLRWVICRKIRRCISSCWTTSIASASRFWGEARFIDDDSARLEALMPRGYRARPEQDSPRPVGKVVYRR